MAKCKQCGKGGLFRKINAQGVCELCSERAEYEQYKAKDLAEIRLQMKKASDELAQYNGKLSDAKSTYDKLVEDATKEALSRSKAEIDRLDTMAASLRLQIHDHETKRDVAVSDLAEKEKACKSADNRLAKNKELIKSIQYSIRRLSDDEHARLSSTEEQLITDTEEFLLPTVELKLQCMNVRQLRQEYTKNQRLIKELLAKYSKRYTTKANIAIYRLMVIALEAELQNILYNIGYGKLDKAISNVKAVTDKYQKIASDGNQQIAPTITRFIGEVEYLFIRAVEIEYEYYVQRERIKEEQRALREQMRQEAAERKELERQRKHIEKEESKFVSEMQAVSEQLRSESDAEKIKQLEERLVRLQAQRNERGNPQIANRKSGQCLYHQQPWLLWRYCVQDWYDKAFGSNGTRERIGRCKRSVPI